MVAIAAIVPMRAFPDRVTNRLGATVLAPVVALQKIAIGMAATAAIVLKLVV
jgi:hypothetical protein